MKTITGNDTSTVTLAIEGMTCGSCERHVRDTLAAVPGVSTVTVSRADGLATVVGAAGAPEAWGLLDAVRRAGYDAQVTRVRAAGLDARPEPATCGCCG